MHTTSQPFGTPLLTSLLGTILVLGAACSKETPSLPHSQLEADLEISPNPLEFPLIPFGGSAEGEIQIRNRSTSELIISGIGPTSCDCVVASARRNNEPENAISLSSTGMNLALAPGQGLIVSLRLDTSRYRQPVTWKSGRIPISVKGRGYLGMDFKADIWTPFWTEPWMVNLGEIGVRDQASGFVVVRADEAEEFNILAPEIIDGWKLKITSNRDASELRYRIDITAPAELPEGPFSKRFSLATDLQGANHIIFTVQGIVLPDLVVSPSRLLFRPQQQNLSAVLRVDARAKDLLLPGPPRAEIIGDDTTDWKIEIKEIKARKRYDVVLSIPPEAMSPAANLLLHTGLDGTPVVRIPIVILRDKS